jgi:hypothetical protein
MIEVFQTNVQKKQQSLLIIRQLLQRYPDSKINFDLGDCDKILRIESKDIDPEIIIDCMKKNGFECKILD